MKRQRPVRAGQDEFRDAEMRRLIRQIPRGKVATYGQVAAAAGFPMLPRHVAKVLRDTPSLPWQRVVGAGGAIKTQLDRAWEQRQLLEMEGVRFVGARVDMDAHQHEFRPWEEPTGPGE
jgi:methylated-DNA-protein-cysteine methyltransferase-like protein